MGCKRHACQSLPRPLRLERRHTRQRRPGKAKELAADVIEQQRTSALYDRYEDLFKYKHNNNPESLIAMQWVPLGDWGVCNTLLADLAGNSKMTGGVNVWSSYQASIDMLQQYEVRRHYPPQRHLLHTGYILFIHLHCRRWLYLRRRHLLH